MICSVMPFSNQTLGMLCLDQGLPGSNQLKQLLCFRWCLPICLQGQVVPLQQPGANSIGLAPFSARQGPAKPRPKFGTALARGSQQQGSGGQQVSARTGCGDQQQAFGSAGASAAAFGPHGFQLPFLQTGSNSQPGQQPAGPISAGPTSLAGTPQTGPPDERTGPGAGGAQVMSPVSCTACCFFRPLVLAEHANSQVTAASSVLVTVSCAGCCPTWQFILAKLTLAVQCHINCITFMPSLMSTAVGWVVAGPGAADQSQEAAR